MIDPREHVSFDDLNDFVDQRLDPASNLAVREHLSGCRRCVAEHEQLMNVLSIARTAPSMLPPDDLWPNLRKQLEARKTLVLRGGSAASADPAPLPRLASRRWASVPFLAAAAVILVVLSSGITALVLRGGSGTDEETAGASQAAIERRVGTVVLPAGFQRAELEYNRTIQELQAAVNAQRGRLSPETVRTVEHSLAVVDSAIAEARAALVADPNNRVLVDLLSANYQRKLDLLRRTTELGSRI